MREKWADGPSSLSLEGAEHIVPFQNAGKKKQQTFTHILIRLFEDARKKRSERIKLPVIEHLAPETIVVASGLIRVMPWRDLGFPFRKPRSRQGITRIKPEATTIVSGARCSMTGNFMRSERFLRASSKSRIRMCVNVCCFFFPAFWNGTICSAPSRERELGPSAHFSRITFSSPNALLLRQTPGEQKKAAARSRPFLSGGCYPASPIVRTLLNSAPYGGMAK